MPEPDDCICKDPKNPHKPLWLCGTELCDRMKDAYFNFKAKATVILSEEHTDEQEPR